MIRQGEKFALQTESYLDICIVGLFERAEKIGVEIGEHTLDVYLIL